jgi:hypothetical protein
MFSLGVLALLLGTVGIVAFWLWPLYRNYRIYSATGWPVVICPISSENVSHCAEAARMARSLS